MAWNLNFASQLRRLTVSNASRSTGLIRPAKIHFIITLPVICSNRRAWEEGRTGTAFSLPPPAWNLPADTVINRSLESIIFFFNFKPVINFKKIHIRQTEHFAWNEREWTIILSSNACQVITQIPRSIRWLNSGISNLWRRVTASTSSSSITKTLFRFYFPADYKSFFCFRTWT